MNEPVAAALAPARPGRKLRLILIGIAVVFVTTWIWVRMTYPYGPSHCCAEGIGQSLTNYAGTHDGWFPHGAATPEASLSAICQGQPDLLKWVRGKSVPLQKAQEAWARDGHLGPESCDWHYIEGLRPEDGLDLPVGWDKVWGLGHNGQRIRAFGHEVILAGGAQRSIALQEWPKFAMELRERLERIRASRATNAPPIRWSDEATLGTNWFPYPK